jgi:translation initiation factor 2 subunit 3
MKGSICKISPIIPISAEQKYNIGARCESMCDIPVPKRNLTVPPKMIIIRSFDVNKPGTSIDDLQGGIVRGSVLEGVLQVGIELRPGHMFKDSEDNVQYTPIKSQIVSLMAENNPLLYAVPGDSLLLV